MHDNPPTPDNEDTMVKEPKQEVAKTEIKVKEISVEQKLAADALQQEKHLGEEKKKSSIMTNLQRAFNMKKGWEGASLEELEKHATQVFKNETFANGQPGRKQQRYNEIRATGDMDKAKAFLFAISVANMELPDEKNYDSKTKSYVGDKDSGGTYGL